MFRPSIVDTAQDVYAGFRNSSFFPSLNGVRALCALLVVKEHANWRLPGPRLTEYGFLGVDMFFVISGFLIVTLLLRERDASQRIDLGQFYLRRTLRIFPIYYLAIAVIFLMAVASYRHSPKTWELYKWSFPVLLLYLQDLIPASLGLLFHTWSLAMEEQFYLVWPTVEKFLKRQFVIPLLIVLIVVNQLCNFGYFEGLIVRAYGGDTHELTRQIFLITFTPILLGVLAAHAMHDPRIGRALSALLRHRWMPPLLLVATDLVCEFAPALQGAARLAVHLLFCMLLLALVINPRSIFSTVLQSRPLSYLGKISYGLYLYHMFVLWAVGRAAEAAGVPLAPPAVFFLTLLLTIVVAGLSYRYFEAPIMKLRKHAPHGADAPLATRTA